MSSMAHAGPSRQRITPSGPISAENGDSDLLTILTARLTIEDVEELESRQERRGNAQMSDAELALTLSAQEARASIVFESDRILAQRLHEEPDPIDTDHQGIGEPRAALPGQPAPQKQAAATWGGWFSSVLSWVVSNPSTSHTGTNAWSFFNHKCVICQDVIKGGEVLAPCGHHYDLACIADLFQAATRDESLFPPRCCRKPIPFATVRPHLKETLATLFAEKSQEFGTLNRVYCTNPTCSHFLGPQKNGWWNTVYVCPKQQCRTLTCSKCKVKITDRSQHTCKPDETNKRVLDLGRRLGWVRCPGCERMIELRTGCNHLTCVCRTQFCYVCKAIWKTCRCPQWDERRLLTAAEERVDIQLAAARPRPAANAPYPGWRNMQPGQGERPVGAAEPLGARTARPRPGPPLPRTVLPRPVVPRQPPTPAYQRTTQRSVGDNRTELIRAAVADLRENHDCQHQNWIHRDGGGRCPTCYDFLPSYLFCCSKCQTLACNRCRRNRL